MSVAESSVMTTVGGVVSSKTSLLDVEVQPFDAVTVTVYVPAVVTVVAAVLSPVDQA